MAKKSEKISVKKISVTVITLLAVIVNCYLIYTIYLLNGIEIPKSLNNYFCNFLKLKLLLDILW